jgi:anaerobic magnesium-protoporphyrin IX monomethyl ester cyclase
MTPDQRTILLIEPPFYRLFREAYSLDRYPLSLGYLAGAIREKTDWKVATYNADFCPQSEALKVGYMLGAGFRNYLKSLESPSGAVWSEVESTIAAYRPSVVGISAKSQNFASALIVARLVKRLDARTTVVMGGPHPSMVGATVLQHPEIDICVRGEGERTVVELLDALDRGTCVGAVHGISYRAQGRIVNSPPRSLIEDLDSLSFPHATAPAVLKEYSLYPPWAFQSVFATRGCPYNCFFCGSREIWGRRVRFRSPENVVREIQGIRKLGVDTVHFDDDTFGVTRKYVHDLCDALAHHCPGLKWSCETHVKLIDDEIVSHMKAAGCRSIQLGVESGNDGILAEMRKGFTIGEALAACKTIKRHGVKLNVFFIIGFPQETEATLKDTVSAMKRIDCDRISYSIFTPYPGTEAFKYCEDNGLIGVDFDISLYHHQSPANSFCMNMTSKRFQVRAYGIARMVDRKNWYHRTRERVENIFSPRTRSRVRELGVWGSLRRGVRLLLGK